MMTATKKRIVFSRETWEEMRSDDYFREVIEVIEDREALSKAKEQTEYFVDLEDYHQNRMMRENV